MNGNYALVIDSVPDCTWQQWLPPKQIVLYGASSLFCFVLMT